MNKLERIKKLKQIHRIINTGSHPLNHFSVRCRNYITGLRKGQCDEMLPEIDTFINIISIGEE